MQRTKQSIVSTHEYVYIIVQGYTQYACVMCDIGLSEPKQLRLAYYVYGLILCVIVLVEIVGQA